MDEFSFTEKEKAEGNYHKKWIQGFRKTLIKNACRNFLVEISDEAQPTGSGFFSPSNHFYDLFF